MQEREASNIKYKLVNGHKKMTMFSPLYEVACRGTGNKKVFQTLKEKETKVDQVAIPDGRKLQKKRLLTERRQVLDKQTKPQW